MCLAGQAPCARRVSAAGGSDRVLLLWRLESTTAAIRFTDALVAEYAGS